MGCLLERYVSFRVEKQEGQWSILYNLQDISFILDKLGKTRQHKQDKLYNTGGYHYNSTELNKPIPFTGTETVFLFRGTPSGPFFLHSGQSFNLSCHTCMCKHPSQQMKCPHANETQVAVVSWQMLQCPGVFSFSCSVN